MRNRIHHEVHEGHEGGGLPDAVHVMIVSDTLAAARYQKMIEADRRPGDFADDGFGPNELQGLAH